MYYDYIDSVEEMSDLFNEYCPTLFCIQNADGKIIINSITKEDHDIPFVREIIDDFHIVDPNNFCKEDKELTAYLRTHLLANCRNKYAAKLYDVIDEDFNTKKVVIERLKKGSLADAEKDYQEEKALIDRILKENTDEGEAE